MFGSLGPAEIILIMVLALLFFGPKKLPEIGRSIGNAMREFRKASSDFMDAMHSPVIEEEPLPPVKSVEYPTTPALDSPENPETLPYGSEYYSADVAPYVDGTNPYPTDDYQPGNGEAGEGETSPARDEILASSVTGPGPETPAAVETVSEKKE